MTPEQAGESVRGFAWLVSVALSAFAGYLWAHRQRAAEVRMLQARLDTLKSVAAELLAAQRRGRPLDALDHRVRAHNLTLAPEILTARATARRVEAWLHDQQRGASA